MISTDVWGPARKCSPTGIIPHSMWPFFLCSQYIGVLLDPRIVLAGILQLANYPGKLQSCQQMQFGQSIGLWEGNTAQKLYKMESLQEYKTTYSWGAKGPQYTGNVVKKVNMEWGFNYTVKLGLGISEKTTIEAWIGLQADSLLVFWSRTTMFIMHYSYFEDSSETLQILSWWLINFYAAQCVHKLIFVLNCLSKITHWSRFQFGLQFDHSLTLWLSDPNRSLAR